MEKALQFVGLGQGQGGGKTEAASRKRRRRWGGVYGGLGGRWGGWGRGDFKAHWRPINIGPEQSIHWLLDIAI